MLLSYPWLSGAVTIPYDAKALFQAQLQFLANALHSGQSPFWNPNAFVGVPQIADPQSLIFSPAILLAYFESAPSFVHFDTYVLAWLGLGGFAAMKLCQDRGWHPAGGIVAAIVFTFGASAAWRIQHIAQIQSLALFAVTLWLLARALDRSSMRYGALAGLAGGAMVVAPDQVALLGGYVLAGYCVSHWLLAADRRLALRASLRPLACCALVGLVLAMLPLLLTYLFLYGSNRPAIAFSEAVRGSLHPVSLLTGVVADLFGAFDQTVDYWGPYSRWWDKSDLTLSQNMSQIYVGTLPVLLVITVGLVRGALWSRELRFLAVAVAALLLYALGRYTPVFALFFDYIPGVALFRRPVDAVFLIGALLAIAAGYLVHLWASGALPFASPRRRALEAGLIVADPARRPGYGLERGPYGPGRETADVGRRLDRGDLASARGTDRVAQAQSAPRCPGCGPAPGGRPCRSTTVQRVDGAACGGLRDPQARLQERHDPVPEEACAPRGRVPVARQGRDRRPRLRVAECRPRARLRRHAGLQSVPVGRGRPCDGRGRLHRRSRPEEVRAAVSLLCLDDGRPAGPAVHRHERCRSSRSTAGSKPGDLKLAARTKDAYIYENPRALPRALFVRDWKQADFETLTATGEWPQFDPRQTVLLEEAPDVGTAAEAPGQPTRPSRVTIRQYENTKVVLEVDAAHAGFVVLNDVWHPWWTVDVDGEDAPILRANVLFRAVHVPAGRHILTFAFEPISSAFDEIGERLSQLGAHGPS